MKCMLVCESYEAERFFWYQVIVCQKIPTDTSKALVKLFKKQFIQSTQHYRCNTMLASGSKVTSQRRTHNICRYAWAIDCNCKNLKKALY